MQTGPRWPPPGDELAGSVDAGRDPRMARPEIKPICLPCRDECGKNEVPATYRLLVREVGDREGEEVWGCGLHIAELYAQILQRGRPLDVIVHNMETGACVIEAHPRQMG